MTAFRIHHEGTKDTKREKPTFDAEVAEVCAEAAEIPRKRRAALLIHNEAVRR